jgi:hypothetical protein
MYRITPQQFGVLQWEVLRPQREKFVARLRARLPRRAAPYTDEQLHIFCDLGITKANGRDMTSMDTVFTFIAAMLVMGQDFDIDPGKPWLRDVFGDPFMDQRERAILLQFRVRMETREDIAPHAS